MLRQGLGGKVVLSVLSAFVCLVGVEGVLRITQEDTLYVSPGTYEGHPTRRFTFKPNVSGRTLGTPFRTNSKGFRDVERSYEKASGTLRVLCLGDSFTFGAGVPFEETYPHLLEKRLQRHFPRRKVEVLNMGIVAYNTAYEARLLGEEGVRYDPDLVIVGYVYNDSEYFPVGSTWANHVKNFLKNFMIFHFYAERGANLRRRLRTTRRAAPQDSGKEIASTFSESSLGWIENKKAFRHIRELADRHGFSVLYMIFPKFEDFEHYRFGFYHQKVRAALGDEPYVLDLLEVFLGRSAVDFWVSPSNSHPNGKANALVAETLERFLRSRGVFHEN